VPDDERGLTVAEVIEQVQKKIKTFPEAELLKWPDETSSRTLKSTIDGEIQHRYWNGRIETLPEDLE
jgi:hypothetical protein